MSAKGFRETMFMRPVYHPGSIIRSAEYWGIVIREAGGRWNSVPYDIDWWKGDRWERRAYATAPDHITFPISHNDPSIPDEVLARATAHKLGAEL